MILQELVKRVPAFMYCLVVDENVYKIYGETFEQKFRATGKTLFVKVCTAQVPRACACLA
jgi:hypothetical protein